MTVWYRYHEVRWTEYRLSLIEEQFRVVKETAKGVWLDVYGRQRFVLQAARKRFACPTRAEALESYRARKRRQVGLLRTRLKLVELALQLEPTGESVYLPPYI